MPKPLKNISSASARIGGLALHAYGDSQAIARRARRGFEARFQKEALAIDPTLSGEALEQKVKLLKKLYFAKLASSSAKARRAAHGRRAGRTG